MGGGLRSDVGIYLWEPDFEGRLPPLLTSKGIGRQGVGFFCK